MGINDFIIHQQEKKKQLDSSFPTELERLLNLIVIVIVIVIILGVNGSLLTITYYNLLKGRNVLTIEVNWLHCSFIVFHRKKKVIQVLN